MNNENTSMYIITYRRARSVDTQVEEYPELEEARRRREVLLNVSWGNPRTVTLYKQVEA